MRSCPKTGTYSYEQLYWKHVSKEFPGKFKNWMHYDYAKIGRNKLEKIGFWQKFQEVVASRGDFLHPDFPPADIVAANMCGVVSTMEKFIESVSIDVLSAFFTKILEFAVVLRNPDDDSGDVVRRAFSQQSQAAADDGDNDGDPASYQENAVHVQEVQKTQSLRDDKKEKLKRFSCPMGGSVTYAAAKPKAAPNVPSQKKRKKSVTTSQPIPDEVLEKETAKLWVHDVDAVIASVTKHIPHPNRIPGSIDNAASYALLFCWRKEVHMNGKFLLVRIQ